MVKHCILLLIHDLRSLLLFFFLLGINHGVGLMDKWFPASGESPVGCMSATSELADMYTDKLRRMMLQTGHKQLVNAGMLSRYLFNLLATFFGG